MTQEAVRNEGSQLDVARLRAAVIHLLELAVAFEGGGVEIVPVDTEGNAESSDDAALKCLMAVVAEVEEHLEVQRMAQREAMGALLHGQVAAMLGKFKRDPENVDVQAEVERLAASYGLIAGEAMLEELVLGFGEIVDGPSKTAAERLGHVFGVTSRMLFNYVSKGAAGLARSAWSRWVPLGLCSTYVDAAVAAARAERGFPTVDRLDQVTPEVQASLDRYVEERYVRDVRAGVEWTLFGDVEAVVPPPEHAEQVASILATRQRLLELLRQYVEDRRARSGPVGATVDEEVQAELRGLAAKWVEGSLKSAGVV